MATTFYVTVYDADNSVIREVFREFADAEASLMVYARETLAETTGGEWASAITGDNDSPLMVSIYDEETNESA